MSDFTEDMKAVVNYMSTTEAKTDAAKSIKTAFANWYVNLGWYDKNVGSDDVYNRARNFRNNFNTANATTAHEQAAVKEAITKGMTSEAMRGDQEQARTGSGGFAEETPPDPYVKYKIAAAAAGGLLVVGIVTKKLHLI
jgi:hypothetical protein